MERGTDYNRIIQVRPPSPPKIVPAGSGVPSCRGRETPLNRLISSLWLFPCLQNTFQAKKNFRNPSIYEKLIIHCNIDELGEKRYEKKGSQFCLPGCIDCNTRCTLQVPTSHLTFTTAIYLAKRASTRNWARRRSRRWTKGKRLVNFDSNELAITRTFKLVID